MSVLITPSRPVSPCELGFIQTSYMKTPEDAYAMRCNGGSGSGSGTHGTWLGATGTDNMNSSVNDVGQSCNEMNQGQDCISKNCKILHFRILCKILVKNILPQPDHILLLICAFLLIIELNKLRDNYLSQNHLRNLYKDCAQHVREVFLFGGDARWTIGK